MAFPKAVKGRSMVGFIIPVTKTSNRSRNSVVSTGSNLTPNSAVAATSKASARAAVNLQESLWVLKQVFSKSVNLCKDFAKEVAIRQGQAFCKEFRGSLCGLKSYSFDVLATKPQALHPGVWEVWDHHF